MDLIEESFRRLFPDRNFKYETEMEYNRRLGNFNANIKLQHNKIYINLNLQWKNIDEEIKIGLIQSLLLKVFKKKYNYDSINTINIKIYNNFIKNIPLLTPKTEVDPELELSFYRVNEKFFTNTLDKPNLTWGVDSTRKLASYNFHDDTVTVSTIFREAREEIVDYLMYHELLHKFHKFKQKNGRSFFHTRSFKEDEELYPDKDLIEKEIDQIIRKSRRTNKQKKILNLFKLG